MGNKTDKNQENLTYLNNTIISDFVLIESSLFRLDHILNEARKTVISKHLQVCLFFITQTLAYNLALILIKQKIIKSIGHLYSHNGIFSSIYKPNQKVVLFTYIYFFKCNVVFLFLQNSIIDKIFLSSVVNRLTASTE